MAKPQILINESLCTGCGYCMEVCPSNTLSLLNDKCAITGEHCMVCGHCMAACPYDALAIPTISPEASQFHSFASHTKWLEPGAFDTAELVRLMRSRRSIRHYLDKPVPLKVLQDLVRIGATAPSGTNSQKWTFSILPDRQCVVDLGNKVAGFFSRLNRRAGNPILRFFLTLLGRRELQNYFERYYQSVASALDDWQNRNIDRLFHGAPAAILIGSSPGASCPVEDALLASQNILLGAHSLGLGTCLIGYVVEAMKRDKSIQLSLEIPAEEQIYAVIAIGYGKEFYHSVTGRKEFLSRTIRVA